MRVERFLNKSSVRKDFVTAILFLVAHIFVCMCEGTLFELDNGKGLFLHTTQCTFFLINVLEPIVIFVLMNSLKNKVLCEGEEDAFKEFQKKFERVAGMKKIKVLYNFAMTVGWVFFIGNSLQDAHIINILSFDSWNTIDHLMGFIISRIYKLYFFVFFIPYIFIYVLVLITVISDLLEINVKTYPIKNYEQVNSLCRYGLHILLFVIVIPLILIAFCVSQRHNRADITSVATIILSVLCTILSIVLYIILIKKFYRDMTKYKKQNLKIIDEKMMHLHQYIMEHGLDGKNHRLEIYIKEAEYLSHTKEIINQQSRFPSFIRAIFTSMLSIMPLFYEIISGL